MRRHCWIVQLHFKFENHQIQFVHAIINLLMQGLLVLSFLSEVTRFYLFLLKIIWKKIHSFISSKNKNIWKIWQEVSSLTTLSLKIAGSYSFTSNLKIIWWKTDIGSFRNSFGSSFVNWEVTGPHKFLIKVIWNIVFLSLLSLCYTLICSNNKNIWKVWQEVSSFNKFT